MDQTTGVCAYTLSVYSCFPHKRTNKCIGLYTPSILYTLQNGLGYFNHILVTSVAIPVFAIAQQKHWLLQPILGCLSWISVTKECYQIGTCSTAPEALVVKEYS